MIPGTTTKLSESTVASTTHIDVKSDLVFITGSTAIDEITPHFGGGFSGIVILVPTDGTVGLLATTTGNIALAGTMAQNRCCVLVYSKTNGAWYPGAVT